MPTMKENAARRAFEEMFAVEPPMSRSEFLCHSDAIEFAARRGLSLGEAWAEINLRADNEPRRIRGALRYALTRIQAMQVQQAVR